jgi:hypothetical protein
MIESFLAYRAADLHADWIRISKAGHSAVAAENVSAADSKAISESVEVFMSAVVLR